MTNKDVLVGAVEAGVDAVQYHLVPLMTQRLLVRVVQLRQNLRQSFLLEEGLARVRALRVLTSGHWLSLQRAGI